MTYIALDGVNSIQYKITAVVLLIIAVYVVPFLHTDFDNDFDQ